MSKAKSSEESNQTPQPSMDDVLKRMLSTPHKPHKDGAVKPKGERGNKKN